MERLGVIIALAAAAHVAAGRVIRLPLSGPDGAAPWRLTNGNRSISLPARVPGYALGTLHAAGLVGDPLYR